MAWLIRERANAKGRLDRLRKALASLPAEIAQAELEIAALDAVIPRHEVKVEPSIIQGVRAKQPALLGYGRLTRLILECLRNAAGKPIYSTEISLFVAREAGIDIKTTPKSDITNRVSQRLKKLTADGVVQRHHINRVGENSEGLWSLALDEVDQSLQEA